MKNYTITVNGKAYAVTVEEGAVSGMQQPRQHQQLRQHQPRPPQQLLLLQQLRQVQQVLSAYPHLCLAR